MRHLAAVLLLIASAAAGRAQETARPNMLADADHVNWRAIGRVNQAGFRDRGACTGALVAPDLVLTAAHCVSHRRTGPVAPGKLQFVAGWLKGEFAAHRTGAELIFAGGADTPSRELADDMALIRLSEPIPEGDITPLPLTDLQTAEPPLALLGYRRDRPHALSHQPDCHPLGRDGSLLSLSCPVVAGTSGAPVLTHVDGRWQIVAVMVARWNNGAVQSLAVIPDAALREAIADAQ